MERPETKYVGVGRAQVAYQVLGDGSPDLLYCYGLGSHVDLTWDVPGTVEFWGTMLAFCRPIIFDRRGTGASDSVPHHEMPTWEEWAEDLGAVLDAVGSTEAVLLAELDAGPFAIMFAAQHPDRVRALILINTAARYVRGDDYAIGVPADAVDALVELVSVSWGSPQLAELVDPGLARDVEAAAIVAKIMRASATPRSAASQYDYILRNLDVRQALPLIQCPTLVIHSRDNPLVPVELGRYLAEQIPGAELVERPQSDIGGGPSMDILEEVAEFLTGERPVGHIDRILTTVLFTDIVASTEHAAALGDSEWRTLLDRHDNVVRDQLRRFRGKEIKSIGDGFIASFDGPARALKCAGAIVDSVLALGLQVRAGLHTGECEVRGADLAGLTVHIAARVGALASANEVLASSTVKDLVIGAGIDFTDRGDHELKGVPGSWRLYAMTT